MQYNGIAVRKGSKKAMILEIVSQNPDWGPRRIQKELESRQVNVTENYIFLCRKEFRAPEKKDHALEDLLEILHTLKKHGEAKVRRVLDLKLVS